MKQIRYSAFWEMMRGGQEGKQLTLDLPFLFQPTQVMFERAFEFRKMSLQCLYFE